MIRQHIHVLSRIAVAMEPVDTPMAALQSLGIEDPHQAFQRLTQLAGRGVTDDDLERLYPILFRALHESPDPNRSLLAFCRWFEATGNPIAYLNLLSAHPVALEIFCIVTGSSQVFADLLVRQPECFELIADPGQRGERRPVATLTREIRNLVEACRYPELKREALRRWKAREMLRIGVRDLAGIASLAETARAFSDLADACLQAALDIAYTTLPKLAQPPPSFAIIAMGKLGGRELNYSSDIDLMFVHADDLPETLLLEDGTSINALAWLNRLAETLIKILAEEGAHGHVFRVDMRLRPEGRFGPLVRSLSAYRFYYENWAEPWELQALIKARFVAGNRALGEEFHRLITPFVYNPFPPPELIASIVENKRRIERKCALERQTESNIKVGYGGIRDIEFIVQRLQLLHGGKLPSLRTSNTLQALQRLHQAGVLSKETHRDLAEDYVFLRTLEHRLQLLHGHQTQTLPPPHSPERLRLARRMGFDSSDAFETELAQRRSRVHTYLQNLFYGEMPLSSPPATAGSDLAILLDTIDSPASHDQLIQLLQGHGFHHPEKLIPLLQMPMRGNEYGGMPPDTPIEFKNIAARLLEMAARAPNPDAALFGFEALAIAVPNRAQLYAACDDSPQMLDKLLRLAGGSPPLFQRLVRHQEWLESLINPEEESRDWWAPLLKLQGYSAQIEALATNLERQWLEIGARDIWGEVDVLEVQHRLTQLAEQTIQILLELCAQELLTRNSADTRQVLAPLAVFGLGKLGGQELGYASDWDVIFLYDESFLHDTARSQTLQQAIELFEEAIAHLTTHNLPIALDLRLRPWGKDGTLVTSPKALYHYHKTSGEIWEKQALLKARFVAGNAKQGAYATQVLQAISYPNPFPKNYTDAMRTMKHRIETERLEPHLRTSDLKLGHGGLLDIEWLAQWLQMQYGRRNPSLRCPNTVQTLGHLADAHLLDNAEADVLIATYLQLARARNALWLYTGRSQDRLPEDKISVCALARLLGYVDDQEGSQALNDIRSAMKEARRIFESRFYAD
ncbi:glutamine synthetase adenylyltransferase [Chthonomonas calidirosea]|uniref:Glutamine synthetase adenylyltransferase n=2 Tax=Chthonomonas TaxID=1077265 RepID=S0EVR9_CHTCT|nr:Glutamine synthetase adenylyltransferase [Chthonomonas calidirosea T49]CEK14656.1 glutamine synthetase adenylyltransferase [Chthonomonas calidirosea]